MGDSKRKKTDQELIKEYQAKIAKAKKRMAQKEHENQFKLYKQAYDVIHGVMTQKGITDDMLLSMDAKTELREMIFGNIAKQQPQNNEQNDKLY